jgi:hypothetical protein
MIDHCLGGCRQDVGMVLKKPASAGFLLPRKRGWLILMLPGFPLLAHCRLQQRTEIGPYRSLSCLIIASVPCQ